LSGRLAFGAGICLISLAFVAVPGCSDEAAEGGGADAGEDVAVVEDTASQDVGEDIDAAVEDVADEEDAVEDVALPPGCGPAWASTDPGTGVAAQIFIYEASRPDATADSPGVEGGVVCSRAGVIPWTDVTWDEAVAACATVGARLCPGAEWDNGCYGEGRTSYPYGNTYDPNACNVLESPDGCLTGTCRLVPTGSYPRCRSASSALDMTGNASEWVGDQRTFGDEMYDVRGGHYASADDANIRCRNAHFWRERTYHDPMLGFRCCRDLQ